MQNDLIPILLGVIGFLVSVLIAVIGWIGSRIFQRMDGIQELLREETGHLHVRVDNHENRLVRVETHCNIEAGSYMHRST